MIGENETKRPRPMFKCRSVLQTSAFPPHGCQVQGSENKAENISLQLLSSGAPWEQWRSASQLLTLTPTEEWLYTSADLEGVKRDWGSWETGMEDSVIRNSMKREQCDKMDTPRSKPKRLMMCFVFDSDAKSIMCLRNWLFFGFWFEVYFWKVHGLHVTEKHILYPL